MNKTRDFYLQISMHYILSKGDLPVREGGGKIKSGKTKKLFLE